MARPTSPYPYRPASYSNLKYDLADALELHIKEKNITAADIWQKYASVRDWHIRQIRSGNGSELGIKMLFSIAEASGLQARLEIAA